MEFTNEQKQIWQTLYRQQLPRAQQYACQDYRKGFELLGLSEEIPTLGYLNHQVTARTGWKVSTTKVRYSTLRHWFGHYAKKEFLTTDYLRSWKHIDFCTEPDMFHDTFGHLPYLTLPEHAELQQTFAKAFFKATKAQRRKISNLAWYVNEAGLIRENGEIKLFGGALISSALETDKVIKGEVPILPFSIANVANCEKPKSEYDSGGAPLSTNVNEQLFVFDSLPCLKQELYAYFDTLG